MPTQLSNGTPAGNFIFVLSVLTDAFIPALDDNVLTVAEKIRRGEKKENQKDDTDHQSSLEAENLERHARAGPY
jgi:hypothetical protein